MSKYHERGRSKVNGGVTEVALMIPIKLGRIAGERRTYEERLRSVLSSIQSRAAQGIPTEINQIPTIHFARFLIVRPEHYLLYSDIWKKYVSEKTSSTSEPQTSKGQIVLDEYKVEILGGGTGTSKKSPKDPLNQDFRSYLFTLILFDNDVKVYGREIASFIRSDVDKIYQNCENYPYARNFPAWWDWFRRYQLNTDVFYNACPGLTVSRIKELELFKAKFDAFIAKARPHGERGIEPVDALLDEFIRETQMISSNFPSSGGVYKDPLRDN